MSNRIKYLSFLIVLFSLILFFVLQRSQQSGKGARDAVSFAITDTAVIDRIVVGDQVLEKAAGGAWTLNEQVRADEEMVRSLLSLMNQLEVKRPVPESQKENVMEVFAVNGIEVRAYDGENLQRSFLLAGDEEESYAMQIADSKPYAVYIPGYFIKIRPIFDIDAESWRDRTLLRLNWRSLKEFRIDYNREDESKDLRIYFDNDFYSVEGVEQLDSAKLYYYITDVAQFRAERFLNAPRLKDSLAQTQPFCTVEVNDINYDQPKSLHIYTVKPNIYGILYPQQQLVQMRPRSLSNFLSTPNDFKQTSR